MKPPRAPGAAVLALLAAVAGAAPRAAADGPRVTGTLGRFYTGSTTGWEGALLVDPVGQPAAHKPAPDEECERGAWNFGAAQGVELNEALAHYTEGEAVLTLVDGCQGIGVPLAGVSLGAGVRRRGSEFAGQQATVAFFTLPWPVLQFYGRRIWNDPSRKAPTAQFGIMFKLPLPLWGYDWSGEAAREAQGGGH